jgi:hypothetical protein
LAEANGLADEAEFRCALRFPSVKMPRVEG